MTMLFHIRIFLQTLRKNYTYTGINIGGLAIGITASVLIFFWVHHERSFDRFHPDAERIYRILVTTKYEDNTSVGASTSLPFIQACESEIPEIETIAVLLNMRQIEAVTVNNTVFSVKREDGVYVDKAWLEMFHSELLYGSFEAYGNHPYSVALTESGAKKYFGDAQATGQIVRINNDDYMVQAVVKDHPSNSSFRYHIMASSEAVLSDPGQRRSLQQWGWMMWTTFVKLHPDADISQVVQKMNDILPENARNIYEASLQLLTDIYFSGIDSFNQGNAKMVSIFGFLGILLLCTACINYINLTTAKVTQRAKEVGVKKIVGANSRTLFLQFVTETFIVSLAATLVALYLIRLLVPQYQSLIGDIPVSFSSPVIWIITGIALIFVTILNGIYPALMLISFHPVNTLKGRSLPKMKDSNLRRALVIFQFTLSAALIISVITIYRQMHYIQNTDPGFRKDHIVRVQLPIRTMMSSGIEQAMNSLHTIKGKLLSNPDVVGLALSGQNIENNRSSVRASADWNGRAEDFNPSHSILKVDEHFMDVFELQMVKGRWFDGSVDMQNVILNETAIRELKILEPYIGQRFDLMGMKGNIIGVVKDFHFRSMREKITPMVIYQQDPYINILSIKTQVGKSVEVVRAVEGIWNEFFPNDPFDYTFLDDSFNRLYQSDFRTSRLMMTFSILAVFIAVLGLFGLSTFAIERRTKEIGIRKVLGASVSSIIHLLTREFLALVAVAFVIAAPVSWWAMNRWLENFAYRIHLTVWIFVAGAAVTLLIALIAVGFQAVRAATRNPANAIKIE